MSDNESEADALDSMLAQLRAKQEKIQRAIDALQALRGIDETWSALPTGAGGAANPSPITPAVSEIPSTSLFRAMSIGDASIKLLRLRDRPMKNPEITRELKAGGLIMNSKDAVNTVGAVLLRRSQQVGDILKTSQGEWALKEWTRYAKSPKVRANDSGDSSSPVVEDDDQDDPIRKIFD